MPKADVHKRDPLPPPPPVADVPKADITPPWRLPPPPPVADVPKADITPPLRQPLPPPPPQARPPAPPPPPPPPKPPLPPATGADSLITSRPPSRRVTIDSCCEAPGCDQKREAIQCLFCAAHCSWPSWCSWPANITGLCTVHWNKPYRCQYADGWCHHSSKQKDKASCYHPLKMLLKPKHGFLCLVICLLVCFRYSFFSSTWCLNHRSFLNNTTA